MEYSEKVVSAISQAIVTALKKTISDNSRQVDTKLKNIKISGDNIMPLSINSAHIKEASIDVAKVKNFTSEVANIAVANIENATIDTAQIKDLAACVANITVATIETADITWAEIAELSAAVADIATAEIDRATIKYAQIEGLTAGSALITEMVGGKVGIVDLAVMDANIVELNANKINAGTLSVERLVIVGSEESIVYALNEANGTAQLSQTTIDGGSITRKTITADQIVAQGITAECLNVKEIFANEALIGAITTANLNADEIAANAAFIGKLTTSMIQAPEFAGLNLASTEFVKLEVKNHVPDELSNTALTITQNGINMLGGKIAVNAGSFMELTSGSKLDVNGGTVNVKADSSLAIESGGSIDINGGSLNVNADSTIAVKAKGAIAIDGGELNVTSKGKINLSSGTLAVAADGAIEVASAESIKIGTKSLKGALDDKYTIFTGVDINDNGVTVSGKQINLLTSSGIAGVLLLGSDQNKLTSAGVLSLADGNILLDGPNNTATIGNGGGTVNIGASGSGTVNIGTSGSATINLATYNIKSSTESTAFDAQYAIGGTASSADSTNTIIYTKTDDDGSTSSASFTITAQYKSATVTSKANPSITDGKLLQLIYQTKGLNMYADTANNRTILSPSVSDGNLLGWNVVSAVNIGATNMSAATLCANNMYLNGIAVADQKWTIDTIANVLNNNDVIPSIKSRADSAYWGAYRKPELVISELNGVYTLTVKTAGGESNSVNFNRADTDVSVGTNKTGVVFPVDGQGNRIGTNYKTVGPKSGTEQILDYTDVSKISVAFDLVLQGEDIISRSFVTIDGGDIYKSGEDSVTLTQGTWSNGTMVVSASNGDSVTVSIPAINLVKGSWTDAKTIAVVPWHGSKQLTGTIMVDGTPMYEAGEDSVVVSAAGWASNALKIELTNDQKYTYTLIQGETTETNEIPVLHKESGITAITVDANSVYKKGWNACRGAMTEINCLIVSSQVIGELFYANGTSAGTGFYRGTETTLFTKPAQK